MSGPKGHLTLDLVHVNGRQIKRAWTFVQAGNTDLELVPAGMASGEAEFVDNAVYDQVAIIGSEPEVARAYGDKLLTALNQR